MKENIILALVKMIRKILFRTAAMAIKTVTVGER